MSSFAQRVLFLTHPGTNSRDILLDVADGYREAGAEVFYFELAPLFARSKAGNPSAQADAQLFGQILGGFIQANRINLAVGMWANPSFCLGVWEGKSFFEHLGLPIVMQWLDAPQWAHGGGVLDAPTELLNGPRSVHIINNAGTAHEMQQILGFQNVLALSNAASPTRFRPCPSARKDFDIVFAVGADGTKPTELMLAELAKDEPDILAIRTDCAGRARAELCQSLAGVWNNGGGAEPFVDAMIAQRLANRHQPVLQQLANVANARPEFARQILALLKDRRAYVDFSMKLRERIEGWERAFTFAYLARHFRCASFGFQKPFEGWPGQWEWLGSLPYDDQAKAYGRGHFGLNVMRWQDDGGLNLKPFEVTLSGACLLQSQRVDFGKHFAAGEAVVFSTPQECRRQMQQLLAEPARIEAIAAAGRARSLTQHCWRHRAAEVLKVFTPAPAAAASVSSPASAAPDEGEEEGDSLVFVLGMWRGGTTLLRKILDSHSQIYAPAETWFLLPLWALWTGEALDGSQHIRQSANAVRSHLKFEQFVQSVRGFAGRFYRTIRPPTAKIVVDKTPLYLRLSDALPVLFPKARFLVLTRDPRGTVWSRHTWKHIKSETPVQHFQSVAEELQMLNKFFTQHASRSMHVSYEQLCEKPDAVVREMCDFLGLPLEPGMVQYGDRPHHEGYGDEKTRQHRGPHTDGVRRWESGGAEGIAAADQTRLAVMCQRENLLRFGYRELASRIDAPPAEASTA